MGTATISIPLVTLRQQPDGTYRPRFFASPLHRKLGLKGEDLRHQDGRWFTLEECIIWSADRQKVVAELVANRKAGGRVARKHPGYLTVGDLLERWLKSPRLKGEAVVEGKKKRKPLAPATISFYAGCVARIRELDDGALWALPAAGVTAEHVGNDETGILHKIEVKHGLATARGVRAMLSVAWDWGLGQKFGLKGNPAKGSGYSLPVPEARVRCGEPAEIRHLVAAADAIGLPEIGDSIALGVWSGQRQSDRLALTDAQFTPDGITFRQHKKGGQPLLIPPAPELTVRLKAAKLRRAGKVHHTLVVLDETAGAPFQRRWYHRKFERVREAAVRGVLSDGSLGPEADENGVVPPLEGNAYYTLKPMPGLADFHDQDLRDTAVTWLARAGCELPQIAAITGHSLDSINQVLRHYLGLHPELARTAIGKLVTWFDQHWRTKEEGND